MIVLENINKTYKSKKGIPCHALKNVNVKLGNKGLYFILGKSGSGKSTLLNILGCLDKADSGKVYFNGNDITHYKEKQLENFRNREIGFVFQDYF